MTKTQTQRAKSMLANKTQTKKQKVAKRVANVKTQNKYQGLLADVGGAVGSIFGPAGSQLGKSAGNYLSRITGFGEYKVKGNSILANPVPSFTRDGEGVRICHREYISDVIGSTGFVNIALNVNPGLPTVFPWLSSVSASFEEYDMHGLVFEYRPSSGSAVGTSSAALGVVVYCTNYDAVDPAFVTKQQMESYEFSNSTVPFEHMMHPVECAPGANPIQTRYIRSGTPPSSSDLRLYDIGLFQYATQGMQSAYNCGELWVSYDVSLKKPRINPQAEATSVVPYYQHLEESPSGTASASHPFGTGGLTTTSLSNYTFATLSTATTFVLPFMGNYLLLITWTGSADSGDATISYGANIVSGPNVFFQNTMPNFTIFQSDIGACIITSVSVGFDGLATANTVTVTGPTNCATANCDVFVLPMPVKFN
jgi:hypothetical protein